MMCMPRDAASSVYAAGRNREQNQSNISPTALWPAS
jgi:hypothetical protein